MEYVEKRVGSKEAVELVQRYNEIEQSIEQGIRHRAALSTLDKLYDEREEIYKNDLWKDVGAIRREFNDKYGGKDVGAVATLFGYDAINAVEHGESGSYTVILNRTKAIFKKG